MKNWGPEAFNFDAIMHIPKAYADDLSRREQLGSIALASSFRLRHAKKNGSSAVHKYGPLLRSKALFTLTSLLPLPFS
jgi:hypothetical protein